MLKKIREMLKKDPGPEPDTGYIVGVSTGMPQDKPTPAGRIGDSMTKGVNFIELMIEHPVAMNKKEIDEIIRIKERMGIEMSVHGSLDTYLTSPCDMDYKMAEQQLDLYIDITSKTKSKYVNFHASVLARPRMYSIPRRYDYLVDENGENIVRKITPSTPKLREWFFEDVDAAGKYRIEEKAEKKIIREVEALKKKMDGGNMSAEDFEKRVNSMMEDTVRKMEDSYLEMFKRSLRDQPWPGDHGTEKIAYEFMGRWMSEVRDPLWIKYCGKKSYIDAKEEDAIAAVAAKYVEGHMKKNMEKLQKRKVVITLESPDARGGQYAGYYRLQTTEDIYKVVKHIDSPNVRILVDFEHLATQGIDPEKDIDKCPSDVGEYVMALHVGTIPMPAHKHMPSPRGDVYIYKLVWKLRQKGFRKGIFIFERGGLDPSMLYEQIIITLKDVAKYVSKGIPPEELPEEYFGLTKAEMEHEKRVVDSYMFEPLQGMLEMPELTDTWLGGEAIRKKQVRPDTWKKEEHR